MAWKGLKLTADGQSVLSAAQAAQKMKIRSIAVGDGTFAEDPIGLKGLVNPLYEIEELEITLKGAVCTVTAELPDKEYEYCFREIGVLVETDDGVKLYAYDNCGEDAQQVLPSVGSAAVKRRVRLTLTVANVAEVTVTNPVVMYVTYDDFQEAIDGKVDVEEGKGLSSNDYTNDDKKAVGGLNGLTFGQDAKGNWGYTAPGAEGIVAFGKSGAVENDGRFERLLIGYNNNATFVGGDVLATFPSDFEYKFGQVFVDIVYSLHSYYGIVGCYTTGMVFVPMQANYFRIQLDGLFLDNGRKLLLKREATIKNRSQGYQGEIAAGDEIVVSGCAKYDLSTGTFTDKDAAPEDDDIFLVPLCCFLYVKNKSIRQDGTEMQ